MLIKNEFMKATDQLMHEHEAVLRMLNILNSVSEKLHMGEKIPIQHLESMIDFLQVFVDKCHHGKEEALLFPELEKRGIKNQGGPIGVMLAEHVKGRNFVKELATGIESYKNDDRNAVEKITENAGGYINLLNQHIIKENTILFMMADRVLAQAEQEELVRKFDELEERVIGHGKHLELHTLLESLEKIY
jgi:hemerythrin-like domain-containing protein